MSDPIETWNLILTEAGLEAALAAKRGGFAVDITHMVAGDAAYEVETGASGRTAQTELQNELQRVEISEAIERGNGQTSIAAVFDGPGDFYVREIGILLDDGTLYAVVSHPRQAMFWKSAISTGYVTVDLVLGAADPENVRVIAGGAPIQLITSDIREDLANRHNLGGDFNFALTRDLKHWKAVAVEELEREAMIWRATGQSGLTVMRQYAYGGDDALFRPAAVSRSALGQHDHPEYRMMSGLPELQAAVNGYSVQTRHTDYRWLEAADGRYLASSPAAMPELPAAIAAEDSVAGQMALIKNFYRALASFDPAHFAGFRDHVDVHVSYLEIWPEEVIDSRLVDAVHSFRHTLDGATIDEVHASTIAHALTGQKAIDENTSLTPRLVRLSDDRGTPRYAVTRYRVLTKRLGTLTEWPVDDMVDVIDDPATRMRFDLDGKAFANSRQSRFRVLHAQGDIEIAARSGPGLLDRIMAQIPGLDGPGAEIAEQSAERQGRVIRGFGDTDLNAARYSRWHAKPPSGTGSDTRRGFNDPTLFVAQATREEVAGFAARGHDFRVSWAIPMEIILAPPHMAWNPYRLPELEDRAAVTANGANGNTAATAYAGIHPDRYWYMTPDELFTGRPGWRQRAWVRDPDGTARLMRASGVYIFMPAIENCGPVRLRYPIAPIHHEGSPAYGHALAIREEAGAVQAALTGEIIALKEQARRQDKAIEDLKTYQKAIKDALFREAHANRGED